MTLISRICGALEQIELFATDATYASACAFVGGADYATDGTLLLGFREWLVTKLGHSNSLSWQSLVLEVANRNGGVSSDTDARAIKWLQKLLQEFEVIRLRRGGIKAVFVRYQRWLEQQDWFDVRIDGVEDMN